MQVHPRVRESHPEIGEDDVRRAWENPIACAVREVAERELRVGFDAKARLLEMVGVLCEGDWVVYHAMTPPSKKTVAELEKASRRS